MAYCMKTKSVFFSWAGFTLYAILNGMIYQWSFWSNFNINIMEFISVNDILPSIAISIALPAFASVIFIYFLNLVLKDDVVEKVNNAAYIVPKVKFKLSVRTLLNVLLVSCFASILYRDLELGIKICCAGFLTLAMIRFFYSNYDFLSSLGKYRKLVIVILSTAPILMFMAGLVNARMIIDGKKSILVLSNSECLKNSGDKNEKFRYIATVSDKAFAMSLYDKSICVFKFDYLKLMKESDYDLRKIEHVDSGKA